ncbi:hypothetical protein GA0116948_103183 [Chitinophaga costaii]|uniref:Uncharacterized protein n=1 Tax=Chitinophaga costaii TaxID=1335309 RepID=A0A1C4BNK1_9BACT|nr:hypothetical protein [Chitinophaga costaii]PUZ27537.1 hypothetical protein DCM91_04740 [Chitinophaga costaii]SCC08383.1 hypothetical protein GA0116948_103183 [Chitinophaga costaii]
MKQPVYLLIIAILSVVLILSYCGQQKRIHTLLLENERLAHETRDLRKTMELSSNTAQQIADRRDVQQREAATFVDQREYYRRNWQQFIAISNSDYHTGLLGGIKNLKITARNQTEFSLDNVVVAVQYLRSNGDVFKTETYTINNVPAKGSQSITASNSRKGVKIAVKLVSITSQSLNFCWAYDKIAPAGSPDPWKCAGN